MLMHTFFIIFHFDMHISTSTQYNMCSVLLLLKVFTAFRVFEMNGGGAAAAAARVVVVLHSKSDRTHYGITG